MYFNSRCIIRKEAIEEPPILPDFKGDTFRICKALWLDYFQRMLTTITIPLQELMH